jgi:hypothetical protein
LISRAWTYDHGQAVREGDEVGTADAGALAVEVAGALGAGAGDGAVGLDGLLVVLEAEGAGVLADHLDVGPAKALEALAGDVAEGGREVDEVDAGEELGHRDELRHGLDVPSCTAANLEGGRKM